MSRFLRSAVRSRAVTGTTTVGGSSTTTVQIMADGTIRFNDRNGVTQVIPCPAHYVTGHKNVQQPSSNKIGRDDPTSALYELVDTLIARA